MPVDNGAIEKETSMKTAAFRMALCMIASLCLVGIAGAQPPQQGLQQRITALEGQVATLQSQLAGLQAILACMSKVGTDVIFNGCNVHIRSGAGATNSVTNGLGNLIVGYN